VDSISTSYLDEALADFSGYLAIDEVYDGPFCILSIVDNRRYNRLAFRVLDHAPTRDDVRAFLTEFKGELDKRGLKVRGITTDGSSLYLASPPSSSPGGPAQGRPSALCFSCARPADAFRDLASPCARLHRTFTSHRL
jgi:hypothetical protein